MHTPARPLAIHLVAGITIFFGRHNGHALFLHARHELVDDARNDNFLAVNHVVQDQHHATRSHATKMVITLKQSDGQTIARRGHGCGYTGSAATDDNDIGLRDYREIFVL